MITEALVTLALWPVPAVAVKWEPCPEDLASFGGVQVSGCYSHDIVYLDPQMPNPQFRLWHERGHALDRQRFSDGERLRFRRYLRRFTAESVADGPWFAREPNGPPKISPGELLADAYATCSMHYRPVTGKWLVSYGYAPPSDRAQRRICAFIRRAGQP